MVYCVAFGCRNGSGSGKSFHDFPDSVKDPKRRAMWIGRLNRSPACVTPTSKLCQDHFEGSCFVTDPAIFKSVGFKPKSLRLKNTAVPTIFVKVQHPQAGGTKTTVKRKSLAYEKRRNLELMLPASQTPLEASICDPDNSCTDANYGEEDMSSTSLCTTVATQTETVHKMPCETQTFWRSRHKCVQVNFPYEPLVRKTSTAATQTEHKVVRDMSTDMSTDCPPIDTIPPADTLADVSCPNDVDDRASVLSSDEDEDMEVNDPSWEASPSEDDESDEEEFNREWQAKHSGQERKFIVFESCLTTLLSLCMVCGKSCMVSLRQIVGTMAVFEQICANGHVKSWCTQPKHGTMPRGNIQLASSIFFSGCSTVKALNSLSTIGISTFSVATYYKIQRCYLIPAVNRVWLSLQQPILDRLKSQPSVSLAGDARCCSPGHTAKYGSYSMMDMATGQVVDVQLVQSNEVSSSNAMELEGLKRSLTFLEREGVKCSSLTTDRHPSVKKYIRTEHPYIKHWFDVWHVAKGVLKKLMAKAKRKGCELLKDWAQSVSNHIYWCAATSDGDDSLVVAKWLSVSRHVTDVHDGHGSTFTKCEHEQLEGRDWIISGSKAHKELQLIVDNKLLVKDIGFLSPVDQTSCLEAYHKVVCFFAPKSSHFFYPSMRARLLLAAIHNNMNSGRVQKVTQAGQQQFKVSFPKGRRGKPVVTPVKQVSYDYISDLIKEVEDLRLKYPTYGRAEQLYKETTKHIPDFVTSKYEKFDKCTLVNQHKCRFSKKL